jgi:hypothetical protein
MNWHFSTKLPSDKTRDPVAGEFFSSEAIKNAGEALVREGIQNSLDARRDGASGKALVRIYLSGEEHALGPVRHREWFDSAWPHLEAQNNGLMPGSISRAQKCRFLVFEDFETTGLVGDPEQYQPDEGSRNAFFYFFRAEGKTEKSGDDRGRWGVGKQVFPRSSKAQAFFGYTETDRGGMLMGGCILKHHCVDQKWYKPDGFFGESKSIAFDTLTVPVTDARVLSDFRADFRLRRQPGQHGLSVVVPWLDDSVEDTKRGGAFDRSTLTMAVLDGYFVPILEGRLEVELEDPSGSFRINQSTYAKILLEMEQSEENAQRLKDIERLKVLIEVVQRAREGNVRDFTIAPCPPEKPSWSEAMLSQALATEIRTALEEGHVLRIAASLTVRTKDGAPEQGVFHCYLSRHPQSHSLPCHVREDLIIPNVTRSKVAGFASLVRVENGPLGTLLGDSEGPAHTEWQASLRSFKDKYTYGGLAIRFVSEFPYELVKRVYSASKQLDRQLLNDLFRDVRELATLPGTPRQPAPDDGEVEGGTEPPPPEIERVRAVYRIGDLETGFVVAGTSSSDCAGSRVRVSAAYETSKGNPFKAYDPNDFRFADGAIEIDCVGCVWEDSGPNIGVVVIQEPDFTVRVTGFDTNRDLVVKAAIVGSDIAAQGALATSADSAA